MRDAIALVGSVIRMSDGPYARVLLTVEKSADDQTMACMDARGRIVFLRDECVMSSEVVSAPVAPRSPVGLKSFSLDRKWTLSDALNR